MSAFWSDLLTSQRVDLWLSLGLAAVLGGAIGVEREIRGKSAGLRTNILICVGAALFTHLSVLLARDGGDPTRIASQVVTGVGFLGAGSILRRGAGVTGLTTAATIWIVAAVGVAVGVGARVEAVGTALLVVLVLTVVRKFEPHPSSDPDPPQPEVDDGS